MRLAATRRAYTCILAVILAAVPTGTALALTQYHVRLSPQNPGQAATASFDFASSDTNTNTVRILNFTHNGSGLLATSQGGPVFGKLFEGANPADTTTIEDFGFYNQLNVGFSALGGVTAFTVELSEIGACAGCLPDEFGLFLIQDASQSAFPTGDDLGADALVAIDITGQGGGDLAVFSPATFVPPDSILLTGTIVSVPEEQRLTSRLHFLSAAPNPSANGMRFTYEVPPPGGDLRVRVFDLAGRLVAEPFVGRRSSGRWTTEWDTKDGSGRRVSGGVYLVHLQMAGQSLTRRVVVAR